jgi:hypothetical protein
VDLWGPFLLDRLHLLSLFGLMGPFGLWDRIDLSSRLYLWDRFREDLFDPFDLWGP